MVVPSTRGRRYAAQYSSSALQNEPVRRRATAPCHQGLGTRGTPLAISTGIAAEGRFITAEATASVDPFTEMQIQQGLEMVMRDRTAIVIAHRLSTVRHADRIIVMDQGQIIEEGTHDGLLAQGGRYADLYNTYFRHQALEYRPFDLPERVASP